MENIKAQNLLNKIHRDLNRNGIITNTITEELKQLRELVVEEGNPLLAKVIRLTYEHIQANDGFEIAIPEDEPLEDEVTEETEQTRGEESLDYLFSLMGDPSNKVNEIELREYVKALQEYE